MIVRRRIGGLILALGVILTLIPVCQGENNTRTLVDMAGRKVTVAAKITKAYATSQIGIIALYTINPDQLAGWNFALGAEEKKFIASKYHALPVLGSWSGKNTTANLEEMIRIHPDCLVSMGTIDPSYIDSAARIQEQLKIPVVLVDGSLSKLDLAYRFLGNLLGNPARAAQLGTYCRKKVAEVAAAVAKVPARQRLRVYYAEGLHGLETDPRGSFHTEVLDLAGGINVAETPLLKGYGRSRVSLEQLLAWDPEVIIAGFDKETGNGSLYDSMFHDADWANLKAVKAKRVYQIPAYPFDWFDRPPGVNRIIGVSWLANLLYPQYVKLDLRAEIREFYRQFYHRQLTAGEVTKLLQKAR
jgi:iron complex transport system substrate-binding protein